MPEGIKYIGVCRRGRSQRWIAQKCVRDRMRYLGSFGTPEAAARAHDAALFHLWEIIPPHPPRKYNFPDEIDPENPPPISEHLKKLLNHWQIRARMELGLDEDQLHIPVTFRETLDEEFALWFQSNPHAEKWEGTCKELHDLVKHSTGMTLIGLGRALRKLKEEGHPIRLWQRDGRRMIQLDRNQAGEVAPAVPAGIKGGAYRMLLRVLRRCQYNPSPKHLGHAKAHFNLWADTVSKFITNGQEQKKESLSQDASGPTVRELAGPCPGNLPAAQVA